MSLEGGAGNSAVPQCYRHVGTRAETSCYVCLKPICAVCTLQGLEGALCPACAAQRRSAEKRKRVVTALLSLVGASAVVALGLWWKQRPDYQGKGAVVEKLQAQLEKEPCDRAAAVELGDLYVGLRLYPQALELTQGFFARCPAYPRLLWVQYSAHKYARNHDAALVDATALIETAPDDKDYWWWRGMVHELRGRMDLAAPDYRQSLALLPRLESIPFNLAAAYEATGQPCDAALPLQVYLGYHPSVRNAAEISARVKRLLRAPACKDWLVVDAAREKNPSTQVHAKGGPGPIAPDKATGLLRANATINTNGPFKLGMDENSGYVLLTPAAAQRLAVGAGGEKIRVATSSGVVVGSLVELGSITLGAITVPRVKAAVLSEGACKDVLDCDGTDGGLGASLLARVKLEGRGDGSLMVSAPSLAD